AKGDLAVRDLVASREPLIAFALRSTISRYDLDTVEGRVAALRATAPMVAKIKDRSLLGGYSQRLPRDPGLDGGGGRRAVEAGRGAAGRAAGGRRRRGPAPAEPATRAGR